MSKEIKRLEAEIFNLESRITALTHRLHRLTREAAKKAVAPRKGLPVHKDKRGRTYPHIACKNCGAITTKPPYYGGDSGHYCAKKECIDVMARTSPRDWGLIIPTMVEEMD